MLLEVFLKDINKKLIKAHVRFQLLKCFCRELMTLVSSANTIMIVRQMESEPPWNKQTKKTKSICLVSFQVSNSLCGIDKAIHPNKLLAELNDAYLLDLLDNTEDPTNSYKTSIFPVAKFTQENDIYQFPTPCGGTCAGLYSLILIPRSEDCYSKLFQVRENFKNLKIGVKFYHYFEILNRIIVI